MVLDWPEAAYIEENFVLAGQMQFIIEMSQRIFFAENFTINSIRDVLDILRLDIPIEDESLADLLGNRRQPVGETSQQFAQKSPPPREIQLIDAMFPVDDDRGA